MELPAIRPLTAALALQGGSYKLSGVPRMHERPIGDLVDGLRQVGAVIDYLGNEGFPPLHIQPAGIRIDAPIRVRGDVSSQFLTALLMSLPMAQSDSGRIEIEVVGELTIRDVTRPVTLDVRGLGSLRDPWGNERAGYTATARIDRKDFGLHWNQTLETGGVLVGDEVKIDLEVELVRESA